MLANVIRKLNSLNCIFLTEVKQNYSAQSPKNRERKHFQGKNVLFNLFFFFFSIRFHHKQPPFPQKTNKFEVSNSIPNGSLGWDIFWIPLNLYIIQTFNEIFERKQFVIKFRVTATQKGPQKIQNEAQQQ